MPAMFLAVQNSKLGTLRSPLEWQKRKAFRKLEAFDHLQKELLGVWKDLEHSRLLLVPAR